MPILFDYFTLKIIWWLLVGALLIGFAVMDGFDLGVGALLPFVAKRTSSCFPGLCTRAVHPLRYSL